MSNTEHPMRLCIHGHFYQPPRENPWTGRIEAQESAAPHHDWNARIDRECYAPNGASRLLDGWGRIRAVSNNYRWLSFNFGPTLLDWIAQNDPETLELILEADRQSMADQNGHGNALAQVYNHAILPLGTRRDRRTQIQWGLRDFERRFGRKAEGMWLAETAIDMNTVVDLIESGVKFTVLAPTQAERVRALSADTWTDVSDGTIDPGMAYRIYPLGELGEPLCGGHLDVFFYDGPISSAVGFEHLLRDASGYYARLKSAWVPDSAEPRLVSVATDGESYGHHEPFGDMALAYLFESICPADGVIPTNFGHFLSIRPPEREVRLKNAHGEGTAWSCAHGTGRWQRDCGCRTGGPENWNQAWRAPLRQAMSLVRDEAELVWDALSPELFSDPWEARLDWVSTRNGSRTRTAWLDAHLKPGSFPEERSRALRLAELVLMGQFSLTSCGWFFDDLGGLEPVQNLRYARRACELIESLGRPSPERRILAILDTAVSNVQARTGRWIWENWVRPVWPIQHLVAAHAAFELLVETHSDEKPSELFHQTVKFDLSSPVPGVWQGKALVEDDALLDATTLRVLAWQESGETPQVRILEDGKIPAIDWNLPLERLGEAVERAWICRPFHLMDLLLDRRLDLAHRRIRRALDDLRPLHEGLDAASDGARRDLGYLGIASPAFLLYPRQVLLENRLRDAVRRILEKPDRDIVDNVVEALEEARSAHIVLSAILPEQALDASLRERMKTLGERADPLEADALGILLDLSDAARIPVSKARLENAGLSLRERKLRPLLRKPKLDAAEKAAALVWIAVLERLNFDMTVEREAANWGGSAK
jgi:hypothetical protein